MTATATQTQADGAAADDSGTPGGRRRRVPGWVIGLVVVVLLALLAGRRTDTGEPLDPDNPGPLGTKALFVALDELGHDVERIRGVPGDDVDRALVLGGLPTAQLDDLATWVEQGGTLVVTDPSSALLPSQPAVDPDEDPLDDIDGTLERSCSERFDAVAEADTIDVGERSGALRLPSGGIGCFPYRGGFFVVADDRGDGTVIATGGPDPFVNELIGKEDNAALILTLLAPEAGSKVALVEANLATGGTMTLSDLVPRGVKQALVQLLVAFGFVVLWRVPRLAKPVEEPQAVQLAGSELVVASGNLLQQARQRDAAAAHLQRALARTLGDRFGVPPMTPPEQLVELVLARTALDRTTAERALLPGILADEAALVSLAAAVDTVRREVHRAR